MKRCLLPIAALAVLATSADARIITYSWHQTSTTRPGLVFTAYYNVEQGAAPLPANSNQTPFDFGGLVGLYIEGGGYPVVTLADLVPSCLDWPGCMIGGAFHDYGSPSWTIAVPNFYYFSATELSHFPWHSEWNYIVTATSITLGDDNADAGCFNQYDCYTTGFWRADDAPEPATLLAFAGGLLSLSWLRWRDRQKE